MLLYTPENNQKSLSLVGLNPLYCSPRAGELLSQVVTEIFSSFPVSKNIKYIGKMKYKINIKSKTNTTRRQGG